MSKIQHVILYRINRRKSRSSDIEDAPTIENVTDASVTVVDHDAEVQRSEFGTRIESLRKLMLWNRNKLNPQDKIEIGTTIDKPGEGIMYELVTVWKDYSARSSHISYLIRRQQSQQS